MSLSKKIATEDNEQIIFVGNRFVLTYLWQYLVAFAILGVTSFYLFWLIAHSWWGRGLIGLGVIAGLYIIIRTWIFNHATCVVITTQRIADIHRFGWFSETIASVNYRDLLDITIRKNGVMSTIFNYGNLIIETASSKSVIESPPLHEPQKAWSEIIKNKINYLNSSESLSSESLYKNFLQIIPTLSEEKLYLVEKKIADQIALLNPISGEEQNKVV